MTASSETPTRRFESLTAHVPLELAAEIRRLAEDGNCSVSREVAAALRAHIEREIPAMMARALSFGQSRRRRHGGLVSEYELTYTVADDFTLAGRTFRRGEDYPATIQR